MMYALGECFSPHPSHQGRRKRKKVDAVVVATAKIHYQFNLDF